MQKISKATQNQSHPNKDTINSTIIAKPCGNQSMSDKEIYKLIASQQSTCNYSCGSEYYRRDHG